MPPDVLCRLSAREIEALDAIGEALGKIYVMDFPSATPTAVAASAAPVNMWPAT